MERMKIVKFLQMIVSYFLPFIIFIPFMAFFYTAYVRRISAFGCFDDCFNIVAGYFINQGKSLYSEIFFNHQMLMAYISALVQKVFDPINIFALILAHRRVLFIFSFIFDSILILRFRWVGVAFVLFFETTKFYLFGDRFLPEGFIVYPFSYLMGILWYKITKKPIYSIEYIVSGVFVWFISFAREPYVPAALLLFVFLLWGRMTFSKTISIVLFLMLTSLTLFTVSLGEYYFSVFKVNSIIFPVQETFKSMLGIGFFKIFVYPLYVLIEYPTSFFGVILTILSVVFVFLVLVLIFKFKMLSQIVVSIVILGISNIRYEVPGKMFYEAFHMLPWYGMFLMSIFLFVKELFQVKLYRKIGIVFVLLLGIVLLYSFSTRSFIWDKVDPHEEFITNYGNYLSYGESIKILASSDSTLFVDGFDELIYWQAGVKSPYKFSMYTSFMPRFEKYADARIEMFNKNPPDFYYGSCPKEKIAFRFIPKPQKSMYTRLYMYGKPSCLHVRTAKLEKISKGQWKRAGDFGFSLSKEKS